MNYQLIESNLMTTDLIKDFEKELLRIKAEMEYQNTEIRLLRDWRDTWLDERTRVFKENDKLRQALSKVSSIISKVDLGQYKSINSKD